MPNDKQLKDNTEEFVSPSGMPVELCPNNQQLPPSLGSTHEFSEPHNDVATASLIENWIDA